jgi:hypothetical protein
MKRYKETYLFCTEALSYKLLAAAGVDLLDLIHGAAEDWINAVKSGKVE